MKQKHTIQVRLKVNGKTIKTIYRSLKSEAIGNFNPIFCTYLGETYLVKSEGGDLSDPFRREDSFLKTLFIEVDHVQRYTKKSDSLTSTL